MDEGDASADDEGGSQVERMAHESADSGNPVVVVPVAQLAAFLQDAARRVMPRKTRSYLRPFFIDEALLRKIDRRIREAMQEVSSAQVLIEVEVRYADLSGETYNDLNEFLDNAADDVEAESVAITWSGMSARGNFQRVGLVCTTEKPLEGSGSRAPVPEAAGIDLLVSGESRRWVRITFAQLEGLIGATRLSMLFRPLEVFRHSIYSEVGSWILGAVAWYISFEILNNTVERAENEQRVARVLRPESLDDRFAEFVRDLYSPRGSFVVGLLTFLIPYGLLFFVQLLGSRYMRYLVPRSSIHIGLSSRRYLDYVNVFKFLIFTVAIGSALGVAVNLLSSLLE
ncbi:MAG TPA: hypothetical protein VGD67_18830 [Pseudonocardiaceae bacterium]